MPPAPVTPASNVPEAPRVLGAVAGQAAGWRPTHRKRVPQNSMKPDNHETSTESWVEIVKLRVAAMRFGSVQIVVHDGRVTQVESTEKTRFTAQGAAESPPGPATQAKQP